MLAKELITDAIPPLKTSDTGTQALKWMNEFHITHLPIVNKRNFLGLISEEDILDLSEPDEPIGNHKLSLTRPFVSFDQHIYDVIKTIAALKLTLIPVIDEKKNYLGSITLEDLVSILAKISSIEDPGAIITLEIGLHDYSLSEIARIVETNDAIILSSYVMSKKDSSNIEVTLKIDKTDLKHIISTFERFDYTIKDTYQVTDIQDILKDRYDSLIKYLDM